MYRNMSDKRSYWQSLDGLRGFAALIVVFSHTSNSGMFSIPFLDLRGTGKSGVFLFFLLSSFLLTSQLLRSGKKVLTFPVMFHYWQRRFFRIYPLYTLYLLFGIFSTWTISIILGKNSIGLPFSLDWQGFFKHITLQEAKGVTWSIIVEFKFYFVLPFLVSTIAIVRTSGRIAMFGFCLCLLCLVQVLSLQTQIVTGDVRLLPYLPIFVTGMIIAIIQEEIDKSKVTQDRAISILKYLGYVGCAGIIIMTPLVFSLFGDRVPNNYFHKQFILYAVFWSFVILSCVNVRGFIQRFFTLPILRFYGALSFGIYLFHPIFITALEFLRVNEYISAWTVLLASTISAYGSLKFIENPISKSH
jgi:peptidoglycan/LPS O-acetylase OafA/YrhL